MAKNKWWTVGLLHNPQPEEKLKPFNELRAAREKAKKRADCDYCDVIAIWDQDDEIIEVHTAGREFVPV